MILSRNGKQVPNYVPIYNNKNILIGIDSSKSNTALVVGNEFGDILDDYEISGAGSDIDVYQLCWDTRKALRTLFEGANVLAVGIENIITKAEEGYKGIEVHLSRAKITAVFDNLIFYFQDYHNIMPILINNQEWKAAILPEEYRKRTHKKGSKDWFDDMGGRFSGRKDDVTDAVCIFKYLVKICNIKPVYEITEAKTTSKSFQYGIFPTTISLPKHHKIIQPNLTLTYQQNLYSAVELLSKGDIGCMELDVADVPIDVIYSDKLQRLYAMNTDYVRLIIKVE